MEREQDRRKNQPAIVNYDCARQFRSWSLPNKVQMKVAQVVHEVQGGRQAFDEVGSQPGFRSPSFEDMLLWTPFGLEEEVLENELQDVLQAMAEGVMVEFQKYSHDAVLTMDRGEVFVVGQFYCSTILMYIMKNNCDVIHK